MIYGRFWLVGITMTALIIVTSTPFVPAASPAKQITVVQSAEPKSLDPSVEVLTHSISVYSQIVENLVWFTHDLKPDPKLAVSWKNTDPLTWEVRLRGGVKFTNGEPLDADAVIESFKYLTRPGSSMRGNLQTWDRIEKLDGLTVRVKTKVPDARFLLGMVWLYVMPPSILRANPASLSDNPIGTGPYKLVDWSRGERIVLDANNGYWRGRPRIDRVTIKAVPEPSVRVAALRAKQADLIINVPPASVDLIDKSSFTKIASVAGLRNVTIIFDTRTPPFNDIRVRQAMNYAVNKESIVRNILGGRPLIQATPSHPLTFGHNDALTPYPYDIQKARTLLGEAGYPNGFEVEFHHPTGRWIQDVEVAQAVSGMLQQVGVRTKLSTGEYGTFFSTWAKGEYKGMTMIGTLNFTDADQVIQLFLYSKGTWPFYYKDPKLDSMYEQAGQMLDPGRRRQLLRELEAYIHDQVPWLFLYFQADLYGTNRRLKWSPPANELIVLWDADLE